MEPNDTEIEDDYSGPGGQDEATPDRRYYNEQLLKNALLCETDIKPKSIDWIQIQSLSKGCIEIWSKLWMSAFDNSKILSLINDKTFTQFESIIRLRILMNMNKLNYETFDLDNPLTVSIQQQTEWDYSHYITRSLNGLENELQHKYTVEQNSTNTQIVKDYRQQNKPRKLFGLLPG